MNTPLPFVVAAGLLHFGILFASALTPRVLDWRNALAGLHPFLRTLFWVYGAFIVLTIVGFGSLTLAFSDAFAAGEPLARGLAAFIAVFWTARLVVALFVFDARPFLSNPFLKIGYHALTLVFAYLAVFYGWIALGGMPFSTHPSL